MRSSFLVNLQAYSQQLYYQMNSFTGIFYSILSPPILPPCIDLSPPPSPSNFEEPSPMFSTPVGNPVGRDGLKGGGGAWTVCWFKGVGGLGKKEWGRGCFWGRRGGWYPNAHYDKWLIWQLCSGHFIWFMK